MSGLIAVIGTLLLVGLTFLYIRVALWVEEVNDAKAAALRGLPNRVTKIQDALWEHLGISIQGPKSTYHKEFNQTLKGLKKK
jgi:hypothetical protein